MRSSRNVMYVTLVIVGLVTILAVAVALLRSGNGNEGDHDGDGHALDAQSVAVAL